MTATDFMPASDVDSRARRAQVGAALAVVLVLTVYVWIASAGTWTKWPTYGLYYQDQADGFLAGRTSIATQPDPELLALPDPYDPVANEWLRIHDVSLYDGRFYLYWGPVPAVLLATVDFFAKLPPVGDQYLVFAFAAGLLGFSAALIVYLWRRHFRGAPVWTVPLAVLTVGLANPGPFNLGRASIYEAAILAGQMFLVGGIYVAVRALDGRPKVGRQLVLAGLLLACAVGSRASLALPVAGVAAAVLWQIWAAGRARVWKARRDEVARSRVAPTGAEMPLGAGSPAGTEAPQPGSDAVGAHGVVPSQTGSSNGPGVGTPDGGFGLLIPPTSEGWHREGKSRRLVPLACFLAPLLIGAAALAMYNRARFGSVTELGVRYQLAGFNSFKHFETLTSARNVVPNLYTYLLRPPLAKDVFPFLVPRSGLDAAFPAWVPVPPFHVLDDSAAGMLLIAPFVCLAVVPFASFRRRHKVSAFDDDDDASAGAVRWISVLLAAVVILAAVPALILSFSTMRYLADWTAPLMLLALVGFWAGLIARADRAGQRRVWLAVGSLLMLITIGIGPLLGVTSALDQFARHNPALLKRLIESTYTGPVPGIAQVGGPAGIDLADDGQGWWLGQKGAAVDIVVGVDAWYRIDVKASLGTAMNDGRPITLCVGLDEQKPLALTGPVIARQQVRGPGPVPTTCEFLVPLKHGLNRVFLTTPDQPLPRPAGPPVNSRRLIRIAELSVRQIGVPAP